MPFSTAELKLTSVEVAAEVARITRMLREIIQGPLRRRGVVVGLSGGLDSSVVAALCARALGPERVLGLVMHERDPAPDRDRRARLIAAHLGIATLDEPLAPLLTASGCERRRDEAIRTLVPAFGEGWQCRLVLPPVLDADRLRIASLVVRSPDGVEQRVRMTHDVCLQVIAAASFVQRARKMLEYYHADRLAYAVAGTANLVEYEQGSFVKNGDGAADVKPIAHLYKTQVHQLAEALGVPLDIRSRAPACDVDGLSYDRLDACLFARAHDLPVNAVADELGLSIDQVARVYRDIDAKRQAARYLHAAPIVLG